MSDGLIFNRNLNFILSLNPNPNKIFENQSLINEEGGGWALESEKSRIIYILDPGAKKCTFFVKKKKQTNKTDLQAFDGQSFIIFSFIHKAQSGHTVYFYRLYCTGKLK